MTLSGLKWVTLASSLALVGCNDTLTSVKNKAEHPLPAKLVSQMKAQGMSTRSPIMMRIFKEENVLEVWKQKPNGRYEVVTTYEICKWSGSLGPKFKEGDRQAPEGFYRIYPHQMNPNSSYYLSFNMGFPNSYDRSHGRTGSHLMIHGACSSAGCYSMTDEQVLEIFGFARDAFKGGQKYFLVQAFPFRMTAENMARHRDHKNFEFWNMIKPGYDHFEITKKPPLTEVCERRYVFNQVAENNKKFRANATCPPMSQSPLLTMAYNKYQKQYLEEYEVAVQKLEKAANKEEKALIAKLEADKRATERAELAAKRSEKISEAVVPLASLFSSKAKKNVAEDDKNLASGLYKSPKPTTISDDKSSAAEVSEPTQIAQTANVPVPDGDLGAVMETKPPRWQFWRRKAK